MSKGMSQEDRNRLGEAMEKSAARRDALYKRGKPVTPPPEGSRNAAIMGLSIRPKHEIGRT